MRLGPVAPGLGQGEPVATGDLHRDEQLGGGETGAQHERVDLVHPPVSGDDTLRHDAGDGLGDDLHVRLDERRVPVVGLQDPLAAHRVGRGERRAQDRVGHLPAQVPAELHLEQAHQPGLGVEAQAPRLAPQVGAQPVGGEHRGRLLQQRPGRGAVRPVGLGDDVRRGPLEDRQRRDLRHDLGDELDRAGPGAQHGDPSTGQVVVVVPLGGVEQPSGEGVQTGHVGPAGPAQLAAGGDHDVGLVHRAVSEPQLPVGAVPVGRADLGAQADVRQHAVLGGDPAQVVVDLGAHGEAARPAAVRRPGEGVQVAGHVARRTGVGVVAPDPAHVVGPLEHDEVALAVLQQLHGRSDPAEAAADDGDPCHGPDARSGAWRPPRPARPGS